jgi:hypothetical protein
MARPKFSRVLLIEQDSLWMDSAAHRDGIGHKRWYLELESRQRVHKLPDHRENGRTGRNTLSP